LEDIRLIADNLLNKISIKIDDDIKAKAINEFFGSYGINSKEIIAHIDRGNKKVIATYDDVKGLTFELACILFRKIATEMELKNRYAEESKWKYVGCGVKKYRENKNYIYNTIFDSRKYMFEVHIRLLADIYELEKIRNIIVDYTDKMNIWFKDIHWAFNNDNLTFEEISSSKDIDADGIEHPQSGEII